MQEKQLVEKVKKILYENLVTGYSRKYKTEYTYIQPSKQFYRFQFFWDNCFHIFILTTLGETELAKKLLRTQFAMQEDNGFLGHIHYWDNVLPSRFTDIFQSKPGLGWNLLREHMSALVQPPLVAQALQRIWHTSNDETFLKEMLPKLKKYYHWLAEHRDFDDDGLLTNITSFESGMDWKPSYDLVVGFPRKKADYRLFLKMISVDFKNFMYNYKNERIKQRDKFRVKDAGFNTIYVQNLVAMADLCKKAGDEESTIFRKRAEKAKKSIVDLMYDEEDAAFYDVQGKKNEKLKVLTATIFYPTIIKDIPVELEKKVIERHFFNKDEFHTKYSIPSVAIHDPAFNPGQSLYLWRGPTWIVNNWFIHKFLMDKDYEDESKHLINGIKSLIEKSGFREYYNPFTGEGHGAHNFTWAGLVVDMIRREKEEQEIQG